MATVFTLSFRYALPPISRQTMEEWGALAMGYATVGVAEFMPSLNAYPEIWLEEGSLKGRTKIAATVKSMSIAIATYAGLIDGVRIIAHQAIQTSEFVSDQINDLAGNAQGKRTWHRFYPGVPGTLEQLFDSVAAGQLDPRTASEKASALLARTGDELPADFMQRLRTSIEELARSTPPDASDAQRPTPPALNNAEHVEPMEPEEWTPSARLRAMDAVTTSVHVWLDSKGVVHVDAHHN